MKIATRYASLLGALAVAGCAPQQTEQEPDAGWVRDAGAPDVCDSTFPEGTGRVPAPVAYPPAPYGYGVGSTIANLTFLGYGDPAALIQEHGTEPWDDEVTAIRLSDFYNPTGAEPYPEDSPLARLEWEVAPTASEGLTQNTLTSLDLSADFEAAYVGNLVEVIDPASNVYGETVRITGFDPDTDTATLEPFSAEPDNPQSHVRMSPDRPSALLITGSAAWAGPDRYQASTIFPAKHGLYRPTGGEFLLALQQGWAGQPSTMQDVQTWAVDFALDYPAAGDPTTKLFQYTAIGAYPGALVVRTADMKIIRIRIGMLDCDAIGDPGSKADCFAFWETFEKAMAGDPIPGVDD